MNLQTPENSKIAIVSPFLSVITLNINELRSPIRKLEWLNGFKQQQQDLTILASRDSL